MTLLATIPRTSHHPILQYMGVKTKERGPGPFYMYHHINDADVYLGGWEGGGGGGGGGRGGEGRSPTETTLCAFAPCPEEQTARLHFTSIQCLDKHNMKRPHSFSSSSPSPPST